MKKNMRKKALIGWIFISVFALLALIYGVYAVELREPQIEPAEEETSPSTEPLVENVYLIVVDGLRVDGLEVMPFVSELASRGSFGIKEVEEPTYSRPAYARTITGASSSINGINSNFQARKLTIPTIYDIAVDEGLKTGASAYFWFYELAVGIPYRTGRDYENRTFADPSLPIQYAYYYDDFDYVYDDEEIFDQGKRIMQEYSPNLMLVHSMEVDIEGHDYGGTSEEYREAVYRNDLYIRDFVEAIPDPDESIVIITGDHGHIDQGGHGGPEKEAVEVPLVIYGKNVLNEETEGYMQLDLAPTIAALLGLPFSAYMEGNIMDAPFNWNPEDKAQKETMLAEIHLPFVASMYERFGAPFAEKEEISISSLHELVHEETVQFRKIVALSVIIALLIILFFALKLYHPEKIKKIFQGKGWILLSALAATVVYIIVHQLSLRLLNLDYSYSIIEPNLSFVIRLTLVPVIAFLALFLSYRMWMKGKSKPGDYELHTLVLIIAMLVTIAISIVYTGGSEVFLPDFAWYLVYAFTCYHLFITGIMCIIFRRFALKT